MQRIITRYLGIDYGTVRIGLALGDSETRLAIPFTVVGGIDEVIKLIEDEEIDEIVIGAPLTLKNEEGKMRQEVERFIESIRSKKDIRINIFDERLTSKAADALEGGKKIKADRDAIAAMIILQSFLDRNL